MDGFRISLEPIEQKRAQTKPVKLLQKKGS
jgi:hypothetical protein